MGVYKKIKPFLKPFLIILAIYCVAMIAIWRANVAYIDDNGRLITGKGWTSDFNRYSSSLLSFLLLQMRFSLVDISPWSQIVAMFFLSIASLIVVWRFGDIKNKVQLVAATLIGLTPFTLVCWLYKFDAPCMALSLLASVIPLIFTKKKNLIKFSVISLICLLVTLTSYQAFCGVYIVLLLALLLKDIVEQNKVADSLKTLGCGLGAMIAAALFFILILPSPEGYRSTEMLALAELIPGLFRNVGAVFARIWEVFPINWLTALMCVIGSYLVSLFVFSKRKGARKLLDVSAGALFFCLAIPASYGIYLLLAEAPTNARSLVGIGSVFALMAIFTVNRISSKKILSKIALCVPACVLVYLFFIFAFTTGNALAEQRKFSDYINGELASDLTDIYESREELANKKVQIQGSIGYTPSVQHVADLYPITYDLIDDFQVGLSYLSWGSWALRYNYGLEYDHLGSLEPAWNCGEMGQRMDGYYYRISEKDNNVCIEIKEAK